jgi:hypothetical protein
MINVLLIGLGNIGIGYDVFEGKLISGQTKTHAKAILDSSEFQLASIEDFSLEKLAYAHKIISATSGKGIQILSDVFVPDLAVIAVDTSQHLAVVESFAASPKILIIEKPAGSSSSECLRISAWGLQNSVQIFINYFRRYLSCSVQTKLSLKEMNTGAFLSAEINAYGSLLNIFSHFIDLGLFLTNRQIFCDCTNKTKSVVGEYLFVVCESCNTTFRLGGIGKMKCDISMLLEFEFIEILITDNGKRIEVIDKAKRFSTLFECGFLEYENYQKVVYEKIGAMLRCEEVDESYLGLEQAMKVHLFLESVDLNYEK